MKGDTMKCLGYFCIVILLICFCFSCRHKKQIAKQIEEIDKTEETTITIIGQPDTEVCNQIVVDSFLLCRASASSPSQLLTRLAYVTSYNNNTKCPNWVAWYLTKDHIDGFYKRSGVPYYDEKGVAIGIGPVTQDDVKGNYFLDKEAEEPRQQLTDWPDDKYGMTHGHLCPAGDNKWSKAAINQTFLLTNICPQTGKLNSGGWNALEDKCRDWAYRYGGVYIVAGPIFHGKITRTIGESKVAVPDAFFKVVLCLNNAPKALGFIYPNDEESHKMADMVCTVDSVESVTGFDFFESLPDSIENKVEGYARLSDW